MGGWGWGGVDGKEQKGEKTSGRNRIGMVDRIGGVVGSDGGKGWQNYKDGRQRA